MSARNSKDNQKVIQLYVTDLRKTILKGKQSQQPSHPVNNVAITGNNLASLVKLKKAIGAVLAENLVSDNTNFDIYDADYIRIDDENVARLENNDCLVLFDRNQSELPPGYVYEHRSRILPHTRAVTNQEGKFYGSEEHNLAAFAIAELVDNSLTATAHNHGRRIIEIQFHNNGIKSFLAVLDNGCGMNSTTLKKSLRFKAPKDSRPDDVSGLPTQLATQESGDEVRNEEIHPMYLNSNISKFGAGLKQAVFWLGGEARIISKRTESKNVYEILYSRADMEKMEALKSDDAWDVLIRTGNLGEIRDTTASPVLKNFIKTMETKKPSFTHIVIQKFEKGDDNSPLELLQRTDNSADIKPSIEKQLAHIYHYYLHGRDGNTGKASNNDNLIDIVVSRFDSKGKQVSLLKLRDMTENNLDLESRFVRTAAPDPFLFTFEVSKSQHINGAMNQTSKIGGIIRYHPFQYDRETHPMLERSSKNCARSIEESEAIFEETVELFEDNNYRHVNNGFFHVWWNGRLIPCTKLDALPWCSLPERVKNTHKLCKAYGRISGSLFYTGDICGITDNKLNLTTTTTLSEMFNEKLIHSQQSTFQRIKCHGGILKQDRDVRNDVKKNFENWLMDSQEYDMEVRYSKILVDSAKHPVTSKFRTKSGTFTYYQYGSANWEDLGITLQVGNAVKLNGKCMMVGRIKSFYVQAEHCYKDRNADNSNRRPLNEVYAPVSFVDIELQPVPYYADNGEDTKISRHSMSLIDNKVPSPSVETMIKELADNLKLKFKVIQDPGPKFQNGCKIRSDGILFKSFALDIVKVNDETSVNGYLPFYRPKHKKMFVVYRIHKIHSNNSKELLETGGACSYATPGKKPNGYYFTTFDLKKTDYSEIGDYVITFYAYISSQSVNQTIESAQATRTPTRDTETFPSRSRNISSRGTSSSSRERFEIEPDYEIEENLNGRRILKDGKTRIPLPCYEIRYSVVAGCPHKFEIEEFGDDELRIGKSFKVMLSFKDCNENIASASDLKDELTILSSKLVISLVPTKTYPDFNLTATNGELLIDGDTLVISDVVTMGSLDGAEFRETQMYVELMLNNISKKCRSSKIRFHPGVPEKIVCLQESVQIENRCKPSLSCRVLDCADNVILKNDKNPIKLKCKIYRMSDGQFLFDRMLHATDAKPNEMDDAICLDDFKTPAVGQVNLLCKVSYDLYSNIEPISVPITITRSTRPEVLRVYRRTSKDEEEIVEIGHESFQTAKIMDELHLSWELYDGMGRKILFDASKHKLSVNWSKSSSRPAILESGNLPIFKVPKRTIDKDPFTTEVTILGFDEQLQHTFYLTSLPLEPNSLSVSFIGSNNSRDVVQYRMGEKVPDAIVKITDRYNNIYTSFCTEELFTYVNVSANGFIVKFSTLCEDMEEGGSFLISDIQFATMGSHLPLGEIILTVTFRQTLSGAVKLSVVAGSPKQLAFVINDQKQLQRGTFTTPNGSQVRISASFMDASNNFTTPMVPIEVNFVHKLTTQGVDKIENERVVSSKDGIADFGSIELAVNEKSRPSRGPPCVVNIKDCGGKCYGKPIYVQVRATVDGQIISDICHFHVTCRPDVPYQLEIVDESGLEHFEYEAGSSFNFLTVTLLSEDETKYASADKEHLSLHLTPVNGISSTPMDPIPASSVHQGVYRFDQVPTKAGNYEAKFVYRNGSVQISETFMHPLKICAGRVHSLKPVEDPGDRSVSNNPENEENRIIVANLKLVLADQYGNVVNEGENSSNGENMNLLKGFVRIDFPSGIELENLENQVNLLSPIHFINGCAIIPRLVVLAGLELPNFSKHEIRFTLNLTTNNLEFVYALEFKFFNDPKQLAESRKFQEKIETLDRKITGHDESLKLVGNTIKTIQTTIERMRGNVRQETESIMAISSPGFVETLKTSKDVTEREACLKADENRLEEGRRKTKSKSNITPGLGAGESDVLGRIGLLAEIKLGGGGISEDLNLQRLLSWYLQNKLTVIVTETAEKGRELEARNRKEQFMLLDIVKDRPPAKHVLSGPGNPVYAHTLLDFTNPLATASTRKVFNKILGDTIIMDDLPTAIEFMKKYNTGRFNCPTILTRDGRRLMGDGIIGGRQTRMPDRIPLWFGLAPCAELSQIRAQLRRLPILKKKMEEVEGVERTDRARLEKLREDYDQVKAELQQWQEERKELLERLGALSTLEKNSAPRTRLMEGQGDQVMPKRARRN